MRLAGLILESFKGFGNRTVVPMAPITLLFGENSAGKSSILQSLLLMKQSMRHAEAGHPLVVARGDLVDLGGVCEMLYAHDSNRECEIAPLFQIEDFEEPSFLNAFPGWAAGIGLRFGCDADAHSERLVIHGFPTYLTEAKKSLSTPALTTLRSLAEQPQDWQDVAAADRAEVERRYRERTRNIFIPESPWAEHPAMLALYSGLVRAWGDVEVALREWPSIGPLENWAAFGGADYDNPFTVEGYLTQMIAAYEAQGRDLVSELLARYDDYSFERFSADIPGRSRWCFFEIQGCELRVPPSDELVDYARWAREGGTHYLLSLRDFLPTLDEVLAALLVLKDEPYALENRITVGSQDPSTLHVSHPLLPNLCQIVADTQANAHRLIEGLGYVGPLRARPSRYYQQSGISWPTVEQSGANLAEILLSDGPLLAEVNEALRVLEADYQVTAIRSQDAGSQDLFRLLLTDTRTGVSVSPLDVGFGVGQVLPIVAQLLVSRGQVLLFEQPEIHLHPRLQAELGSLLARSAAEPYNNQVIVETHSECLVYRLQKLIRLGTLRPEDVSVVYVTKDERGSHCLRLRLDEEGDFLDPWPGGFFDTGFDEMFGLQ